MPWTEEERVIDSIEEAKRMFKVCDFGQVTDRIVGLEGERPYRYLTVERECSHAETVKWLVGFATAAIAMGGYFTMHTSGPTCLLSIAISRNLTADEIEAERRKVQEAIQ